MNKLPDSPTSEEINKKLQEIEDKVIIKLEQHITFKELIKNNNVSDIPIIHQHNLEEVQRRVNYIEDAYGKHLSVTSGYRTIQDHLRIYSAKGITDKSKIPMKSLHLSGAAVDVYDSTSELKAWINANIKVLEDIGLWCEDFASTPTWVHFQISPPRSGSRFFKP